MSDNAESVLSKSSRRRGRWKRNWTRKTNNRLAKKQKLDDVTVIYEPPAVDALLNKTIIDNAVLTSLTKRKYANPEHLWRRTYENLLKWQTTHQLKYWKNNAQHLFKENTKLKLEIDNLRDNLEIDVEPNQKTDGYVLVDVEDEISLKNSSEGDCEVIEPTEEDKVQLI